MGLGRRMPRRRGEAVRNNANDDRGSRGLEGIRPGLGVRASVSGLKIGFSVTVARTENSVVTYRHTDRLGRRFHRE
jgi:hypothetical protein